MKSKTLLLNIFTSDLSDRQSFIVDGIVFAPSPLVYGIPPVFRFGLVSFKLNSQHPSDVISALGCDFHRYADDTQLILTKRIT